MSLNSSNANYNGRQPNNTSYIKTFVPGTLSSSETGAWSTTSVVYPTGQAKEVIYPVYGENYDVYIPGNLLIGREILRYNKPQLTNNEQSEFYTSTVKASN